MAAELEQGLHVVEEGDTPPAHETWPLPDLRADADGAPGPDDERPANLDEFGLEALRDEFVEAFNARDLDALLALVHPEVEVPDAGGDSSAVLAEEIEAIWERSPAAILTRAFLPRESSGAPCAVAWLPDEDGCWTRAAVVCFDTDGELLTLVEMPEDAEALERAEAEEPGRDELDEWTDWARWDRGEETPARQRR